MIFFVSSMVMLYQAMLIYMNNKRDSEDVDPMNTTPYGYIPEGAFCVLFNIGLYIFTFIFTEQCLTVPYLIEFFNYIRMKAISEK